MLVILGMVQRRSGCGHTVYRLNRTPEIMALLDNVFAWRELWKPQLRRLERMIG